MGVDDIVKMKLPVRRGVGARRPWRVRFLRLLARRQPPAGGWRPQERAIVWRGGRPGMDLKHCRDQGLMALKGTVTCT